ncbi:hypothetical protein B0H98_1187 [Vreelandella songnenensis]|uniref:Uncharacterized protein n=1 Tax=Vreelandella songnenensis TaxID=1176243 RepID=A0A2T0ULK6_9GAMM|nr:hypothetical protein [Halomonas songnenensis]PRY58717.1 hypothetical protein B0H98_1187 [Halomonas songnenensis]
MTDLTPITYADSAHTSEKFLWPRSETCHHGKRFRLSAASGQQLPYRHPSEPLFPASELVNTRPKRLCELEQMPNHSPRPVDRPEHPLRWDEECLRYTSQTKIYFIIGALRALRALGMVGFFLGLFVLCASLSLTLFFPSQGINLKEELILDFLTNGVIIGFFLFLWGGGSIIYRFLPNFISGYQSGPMWELDRRTGMVKVFANSAKKSTAWKVAHELPFHEFDCYLQSSPSSQGIAQYNLSLVHYSVEAHVALVGMFGVTSRLDQLAAWDMVQRFMDTSQPLPDSPQWEQFRPLDPTTLEWDKEIARPPRFWRDMEDEAFNQKIVELQDRLSAFYFG